MEQVTQSLEKLKVHCSPEINETSEDAVHELGVIIQNLKQQDAEKKLITEQLLNSGIIELLISLLKTPDKLSAALAAKIPEVIAELGKTDGARKSCTNSALVEPLVKLLDREENEVVLQACRALGNICYDNDTARGLVKEQDGVGKLVHLLKKLLLLNQMPDNLRTVASGCLLNLTDTYEETQDQALQAGIVEVLLQYLQRFSTDDDVATHCLLVLNCLADLESGRKRLVDKVALSPLMKVMEKDLSDEVMESLLELFGNLAEDDSVKQQLAELGLCERLVGLVKTYQQKSGDEEGHNLMKTFCDLVILILTGDESMELLYKDGKGMVYKETVLWLLSNNDNLQVAGALATGNFARKDRHCIQMVQDGVAKHLLELIEKHSNSDGDIRLQHALLSALRNLAIPAPNKPLLYQLGVTDKLLPMIVIETFPVIFKLLGALRMIIDKQETAATSLGQNGDLLKRLVFWCTTDDHPGIKGEASRMLAWLVKNSRSSSVMQNIGREGGLPHLVTMINSEHLVMQNEALLALALVASSILPEVEKEMQDSKISAAVHLHLQKEIVKPEILLNCLSLIVALAASKVLKQELESSGIKNDLKTIQSHSNTDVCTKAKEAFDLFSAG